MEFKFDTEVTDLKKSGDIWEVHTNQVVFETKYVVNAAGVYADKFHNMVSEKKIHITPRRGDYCLLDKSAGSHVSHTVFALPGKYGKGILISPTVHGNLLLGPTAIDIEDKEGTNTTRRLGSGDCRCKPECKKYSDASGHHIFCRTSHMRMVMSLLLKRLPMQRIYRLRRNRVTGTYEQSCDRRWLQIC